MQNSCNDFGFEININIYIYTMLKLYLCMVENVTASRFHLFSAHAHSHTTKNSTINGNRNGSTTSSSSRRRTKKHKPATTTQLTQSIKCGSRWVGVRSFGVFRLSTIVEFSLSMGFFLTTEKKTFTVVYNFGNRGAPDMFWQMYYKIRQRFVKRFGCVWTK